jgi:hypothetical protein
MKFVITPNKENNYPFIAIFKSIVRHSRVARFLLVQHTKKEENTPNKHKMYQMSIRYTKRLSINPNGHM